MRLPNSRTSACMNANLEAGSGFWFESQTGYLVYFSDNSNAWAANFYYGYLILPFFEDPFHAVVVRHEVQHALTYSFFAKNRYLLFLYKILFYRWFLEGFEELWVAYRSQTLHFYLRESKGNLVSIAIAFVWIFLFVYTFINSLLFGSSLFAGLLGFYIALTFLYWKTDFYRYF